MFAELDVALFRALNGAGPVWLAPVMHALSWLGDHWRLPLYVAGLGATAALCGRGGYSRIARASVLAACRLVVAFAIAAPLTAALKQALALDRPAAALMGVRVFAPGDSEFSFPSGHAVLAGLLVATLWPALPWWGRACALLLALGIAVSRVWLGAHFPSDVSAGVLLGVAVAAWTGWLARQWQVDKPAAFAFGLTTLTLALDVGTKTIVASTLQLGDSGGLTSFLNIGYWRNTGAAFSFLHDAGGWQRAFFIVVALAVAAWLAREIFKVGMPRVLTAAYGLVLGGALANVFDRVFRGAVVDWIDFHWGALHWPAFNVADSAITAGVAMLVFQAAVPRNRAARDVR